jgi:hypothetical protein
MIIAGIKRKWDEFPWKFTHWRNKRRSAHLMMVNSVRERSISTLQNRYGYSKEEAMYQFDKYYSKAWLG